MAKPRRVKNVTHLIEDTFYSVFTHVASIYANLLEQKKAFA